MLEKLTSKFQLSGCFWSELAQIKFPTLAALCTAFLLFFSRTSSFNQSTFSSVLFVNEYLEHSASSTGVHKTLKSGKTTETFDWVHPVV
jgi:hypothetical protein